MTNNRALNLIDTLARDEAALRGRKFLAPLLCGGRARLRMRGLVYELVVARAARGWWVCRARDARHAEPAEEAMPWQRGAYLELWPALRLVLLEPLPIHDGHDGHEEPRTKSREPRAENREATMTCTTAPPWPPRIGAIPETSYRDWSALAYNPSDAAQRFGIAGPLVLRLVEGGQPFDRVIGRVEGAAVWYDEPDRRGDLAVAEALRAALAAEQDCPAIAGLGAGERGAYALLSARRASARAATEAQRAERRLRDALAIGGARLVGYEVIDAGLRVTWERDGQRGVTLVSAGLDVVSAGICLSGQDARFDLSSIVGVVREAPGYARWEDDY